MRRKGSARRIRPRPEGPQISDGPFGYLAGNGLHDLETKEEKNLRMLRAQRAEDTGPNFPEAPYSQDALRSLLNRKEY